MDTNLLTRLQNWQLINCDGDWEHGYGVSIETLDNPGWWVKINLVDTCLENLQYEKQFENDTFDWLSIKINKKIFEASGDTNKLSTILEIFFNEVIPKHSDPTFQYEVFVQLFGGPAKIWRPVKAKLISEDTLQITQIPELTYRDIRTLDYNDLTFQQDEIFKYQTKIQVGVNIKVELIETFNGVTLIAKE